MKSGLSVMRMAIALAGGLAAVAPTAAFAHENVGGDELAAANWMLIGAFVVALTGVLAGLWGWRSGQFTNIEDSKYTMLDNADDFDAIMAEADERELLMHPRPNTPAKRQESPRPAGRARE